jgi:hypothetical protein
MSCAGKTFVNTGQAIQQPKLLKSIRTGQSIIVEGSYISSSSSERCLAASASNSSQGRGNSSGKPEGWSSGSEEHNKPRQVDHSAKRDDNAQYQPPYPRKKRNKSRQAKAQKPGQFEVEEVSPPPTCLGIHTFHPRTHNGDQLSVSYPHKNAEEQYQKPGAQTRSGARAVLVGPCQPLLPLECCIIEHPTRRIWIGGESKSL